MQTGIRRLSDREIDSMVKAMSRYLSVDKDELILFLD